MPTVPVRVKTSADVPTPAYHRSGDAGLDLRAAEAVALVPGSRHPVKTGIRLAIPEGVVGIVKDRSGLARDHGLHTLAGVIDSNYRGEIMVVVINLGDKEYRIEAGERIAQLLLQPCLRAELITVQELPETERNESGFGSSGRK